MREREEGWGGLPEVLIAITLLLFVFIANGILMRSSTVSQQDIYSYNRAIQIARDNIEKTKQVEYKQLGWDIENDLSLPLNDEPGVFEDVFTSIIPINSVDKPSATGDTTWCYDYDNPEKVCLPVVHVPQEDNLGRIANLFPEFETTVGNTTFYTTVIITWNTNNIPERSSKKVLSIVQWQKEDGTWDSTKLSYNRSPNPAEYLPPHLNPGDNPPPSGIPSSPTFIDESAANRIAGFSLDLGEGIEFIVKHPGTESGYNIIINLNCGGGSTQTINTSNNLNTIGLTHEATAQDDGATLHRIYYSGTVRPPGLTCFSDNLAEADMQSYNSIGSSQPLNIGPTNILKVRS